MSLGFFWAKGPQVLMTCQIDQSGKIEQTNRDTVLCISNDHWDAITIKAKTKRQIQEIFRRHGRIRNFILFTFSAGLAILLKRNHKIKIVIIDLEYSGKESIIKGLIYEILKSKKINLEIRFARIGKKAKAHHYAHDIAAKEIKTKKLVSFQELIGEIKKTEVGKRLKNA